MTLSWNDRGQRRRTEHGLMAERKGRVPKVVNENKSLSDEECGVGGEKFIFMRGYR